VDAPVRRLINMSALAVVQAQGRLPQAVGATRRGGRTS
jgi:hypothetical protein